MPRVRPVTVISGRGASTVFGLAGIAIAASLLNGRPTPGVMLDPATGA